MQTHQQSSLAKSAFLAPIAALMLFPIFKPALALPAFVSDDQELSLPASGAMNFEKIRTLSLHAGAPLNILDAPIKFPHLEGIGLFNAAANATYIDQLVANYPKLKSIRIRQLAVLDEQSMNRLCELHFLSELDIDCPISNFSSMKSLTLSLKSLALSPLSTLAASDSGSRLEFPRLVRIDIRGTSVGPVFFSKLCAPNLHKVLLANLTVSPGGLHGLAACSKLREVEIYNVDVSREDIQFLESHNITVKQR